MQYKSPGVIHPYSSIYDYVLSICPTPRSLSIFERIFTPELVLHFRLGPKVSEKWVGSSLFTISYLSPLNIYVTPT